MKKFKFVAAFVAGVALVASCNSGSGEKVEAKLPTKAETDSVSYLIGINFGYFIKANNFGEDLNYSQIRQGMMDFIKADGNMQSPEFNEQFKINPDKMNDLFRSFIEKKNAYTAEVNLAKGQKFLDANKKKDGVVVTESGLQYKILEDGGDIRPTEKDTVWVHYTGTLIDGTEFDASDPTKDPVKFLLKRVVKGWTEGLQYIGEGGHIQLFVPADLGYGERGSRGIEPNSTLIFDIELERVGRFVEKEKVTPVKE